MAKKVGARGFGSIRKEKSGNYSIRYTDPNGLSRSGGKTFSSKALAEKELSRINDSIQTGNWIPPQRHLEQVDSKTLTLAQLASQWRGQAVNSSGYPLAQSTLTEYERLINRTLSIFASKPIRAITTRDLEAWRAEELKREVLNQTSKAYKHLKTLMAYAVEQGYLVKSPCTIKRATAYKPTQPPMPNTDQVLLMIENLPKPFDLIVALAGFGGLRKGEILELRRKDIEQTPHGVKVSISRAVTWAGTEASVKPPKTKSSVRSVILPPNVGERLKSHLRGLELAPEALLFHRGADSQAHFGEFAIDSQWRKVRELAGFKGRFHSLRAYHLTDYALNATTREVMDRGGHTDLKTAMGYQGNTQREAELVLKLGGGRA